MNTMVFACGVPECNPGYCSSQAIKKVAVFRFPKMINYVRSGHKLFLAKIGFQEIVIEFAQNSLLLMTSK